MTHDGSNDDTNTKCVDGVDKNVMTHGTKSSSEVSATTTSSSSEPLARSSKDLLSEQFELYGWKPDPLLSDDENYLDLVFIITRNPARRRRRVVENTCISRTAVDIDGDDGCDGDSDGQDGKVYDSSTVDMKPTSSSSSSLDTATTTPPNTTSSTSSSMIPSTQEYQPQGHMGALIVRPMTAPNLSRNKTELEVDDDESESSSNNSDTDYASRFWDSILGAGTNMPLFLTDDNYPSQDRDADKNCQKLRTKNNKTTKPKADIHAEISALGQACRSSQSTENCTAYITIHPCKNCFGALIAFGISRIVTRQARQNWSSVTLRTAHSKGLEVHTLSHDERRHQMERINQLVNNNNTNNDGDESGQNGNVRTDEELMAITEAVRQRRQERKLQAKKERQQGHE